MPTVLCVTTTFAATLSQAWLISLTEVQFKVESFTTRIFWTLCFVTRVVNVQVNTKLKIVDVYNVVGTITGSVEPGQCVTLDGCYKYYVRFGFRDVNTYVCMVVLVGLIRFQFSAHDTKEYH